ncbi:MAG: BadF/BadG/BcrA/BcrD ATPase family protein [Prevotellaceae bacterium]|nr:BadF/BadG/BcrA/BcrD ATPase family protein [Prevotellaceae bacterium]
MKLIADSGSTKTDWCVINDDQSIKRYSTQGINPFQQDEETIEKIIGIELICQLNSIEDITEVYFYGAGFRTEMQPLMKEILQKWFLNAKTIEVNTDLLGAAHALLGNQPGIACILGTGSNSCLYNGKDIVMNVPPLGYILGDEGSGAVLGRMFVNALFKGNLPSAILHDFTAETNLSVADIIRKVYREPLGNRFLASFSPFIHRHLDNPCLRNIVIDNFRAFFRNNISHYVSSEHFDALKLQKSDIEIHAIGSMAYHYTSEFIEAASLEGYRIGTIEKSPIDGLVRYHNS